MGDPRVSSLAERLRQAFPAHRTDEDIHLLTAICLLALSDGTLDSGERVLVAGLCRTLPEFRTRELTEVTDRINEVVERLKPFRDKKAAVHSLKDIKDERLRRKCFLLALEAALVSGHLSDAEIDALEKMRQLLELDEAFVLQVTETLLLKYR